MKKSSEILAEMIHTGLEPNRTLYEAVEVALKLVPLRVLKEICEDAGMEVKLPEPDPTEN